MVKHEKLCKNNKFKMPAPIWNEEFELTNRSYPTWDIQNYFEFLLKKHGEKTVNPSITIYINKIKNRIALKIKAGYYLQLLMSETINVLGCIKIKITKNKNAENVPNLEISEVILVTCTIVNNNYKQESRV